jgi:hypothetical protein
MPRFQHPFPRVALLHEFALGVHDLGAIDIAAAIVIEHKLNLSFFDLVERDCSGLAPGGPGPERGNHSSGAGTARKGRLKARTRSKASASLDA